MADNTPARDLRTRSLSQRRNREEANLSPSAEPPAKVANTTGSLIPDEIATLSGTLAQEGLSTPDQNAQFTDVVTPLNVKFRDLLGSTSLASDTTMVNLRDAVGKKLKNKDSTLEAVLQVLDILCWKQDSSCQLMNGLVKTVSDLEAKVKDLETRNADLRKDNDSLTKKVEEVKNKPIPPRTFAEALRSKEASAMLKKEVKAAVNTGDDRQRFYEDINVKSRTLFVPDLTFIKSNSSARRELAAPNVAAGVTPSGEALGPLVHKFIVEKSKRIGSFPDFPSSPILAFESVRVLKNTSSPSMLIIFQTKAVKDLAQSILRHQENGSSVRCNDGRLRYRSGTQNFNPATSIILSTLQAAKNASKIKSYNISFGYSDSRREPQVAVSIRHLDGKFANSRTLNVSEIVALQRSGEHKWAITLSNLFHASGLPIEAWQAAKTDADSVIKTILSKYTTVKALKNGAPGAPAGSQQPPQVVDLSQE